MGHMGNGGTWVNGILVNTTDRDGGPWGMGHMGNRAHGQNFLNTAWIFTKILLEIDIDGFSSNSQRYSHDGLILVVFFMFF